jgi:2-polyprenyl-3-methyl-5-hydroxy-6-metoxy-1,4-benzoquinol methylase
MTLKRLGFELRYLTGNTPWDQGQVPPELQEFLASSSPGKAVEFGCGTGTNAIALARRGWQVVAIDISLLAVLQARSKARRAGVRVDFQRGSVVDRAVLQLQRGAFDFALDIGCFHVLSSEERLRYSTGLAELLRPGAIVMMYSFLKTEEGAQVRWPSQEEIKACFEGSFSLNTSEYGWYRERRSVWLTYEKAA